MLLMLQLRKLKHCEMDFGWQSELDVLILILKQTLSRWLMLSIIPWNIELLEVLFLDECRMMMVGFNSVTLRHCPRKANKAADLIARTVDSQNVSFWLESPP